MVMLNLLTHLENLANNGTEINDRVPLNLEMNMLI